MKFCPECGSIIVPKTEDGETVLKCGSCDYEETTKETVEISDKRKEKKTEVDVVEDDDSHHPITEDVDCPECGNNAAHYWTIQTRAGDEPETRFFKCTECKHTWREY